MIFVPTSGERGYVSFREGNKMRAFILDGYPPKLNIAPEKWWERKTTFNFSGGSC